MTTLQVVSSLGGLLLLRGDSVGYDSQSGGGQWCASFVWAFLSEVLAYSIETTIIRYSKLFTKHNIWLFSILCTLLEVYLRRIITHGNFGRYCRNHHQPLEQLCRSALQLLWIMNFLPDPVTWLYLKPLLSVEIDPNLKLHLSKRSPIMEIDVELFERKVVW